MATYEYSASAGDASILGMDVFAATWTGGSATITAVKAKLDSGSGTFNLKVNPTTNAILEDSEVEGDIIAHIRSEDLDLDLSDGDGIQGVYSYGNPGWNFYRQNTTSKRPEYNDSGGLNSLSYMNFDGSDHALPVYTGVSEWVADEFWTMAVVVATVNATQTDPIVGNTDLTQDAFLSLWGTSGSNHVVGNDEDSYTQTADKLASNQIRIVQGKSTVSGGSTLGTVSEFVNGDESYSDQSIDVTAGKYKFNTIGQQGRTYRGSVDYRNTEMQLHEFLMFEGSITTDARQILEGYWANKYGLKGSLPATHPYKTTSPSVPTYDLASDITLASTYGTAVSTSISINTGDEIVLYVPKQQDAGTLTAELTVT